MKNKHGTFVRISNEAKRWLNKKEEKGIYIDSLILKEKARSAKKAKNVVRNSNG